MIHTDEEIKDWLKPGPDGTTGVQRLITALRFQEEGREIRRSLRKNRRWHRLRMRITEVQARYQANKAKFMALVASKWPKPVA